MCILTIENREKVGRAFIIRGEEQTVVTPADWSLSLVTSILLIYQAALVIYVLSSLFRSPNGYLLLQSESLPDFTHARFDEHFCYPP